MATGGDRADAHARARSFKRRDTIARGSNCRDLNARATSPRGKMALCITRRRLCDNTMTPKDSNLATSRS